MYNKIIAIAFLLFWPIIVWAQTAAILPQPLTQFLDNNANPLSSGTVDTYIAGTSTRKTTWQDAGETIPNTNPVVLNAGGRAIIYGDGNYRLVVKDRLGNLIYDGLSSAFGTGGATQFGDGTAVGTVLQWSGLVAPVRYVFAYGQELSRLTYSQLYTAITLTTNLNCTIGSPILSGISDTTQIGLNTTLEASCLPSGTTVLSKTASTVTVSNNATITTSILARFFPWGNGNGTTTFNVPDLRGRIFAGRSNMGGTDNVLLSSCTNADATGARCGAQTRTLILGNLPAYTPTGAVAITDPGHKHFLVNSDTSGLSTLTNTLQVAKESSDASLLLGSATAATLGLSSSSTTGITAAFNGVAQGGASVPLSVIPPIVTTNYVIKVLPDITISTLNVVTSINSMSGAFTCSGLLVCSGNNLSVTGGIGSGTVIGPVSSADNNLVFWSGITGTVIKDNLISTSSPSAGNLTFNGDVYFKSGLPWVDVRAYGAVGDAVTDDTAAFQAAINVFRLGGKNGLVYVPGGRYCLFSVLTIDTTMVRVVGQGPYSPYLDKCGHDTGFFTINSTYSGISNLFLVGKGNDPAETFGATAANVYFGSSCIACFVGDIQSLGGGRGMENHAGEMLVSRISINEVYGSAHWYNAGGVWMERPSFDKAFPCGAPPPLNTTFANWAATTAYSLCDVTVNGSYLMQVTQAGTSGSGSAPALKNYNAIIYDQTATTTRTITSLVWSAGVVTATTSAAHPFIVGNVVTIVGETPTGYNGGYVIATVPDTTHFTFVITNNPGAQTVAGTASIGTGALQWGFMGLATAYGLQMDTGSAEIYIVGLDTTGPNYAGIAMTNTLSGSAPNNFKCVNCIGSNALHAGFLFASGSKAFLTNPSAGACINAQCGGIVFESAFSGEATINGGYSTNSPHGIGVKITAGANIIVNGVNLSNNAVGAQVAVANIGGFSFINNTAFNTTVGFQVAAGTSNNYIIANNICESPSTCVSDQGTGTSKTVTGNDGSQVVTYGQSIITWPNGTTDFTATGGTGRFLKQASTGSAVTVVAPACSDFTLSCSATIVTVVGSLPTCNGGTQGQRYFVTDQNTGVAYLGTVTGGGSTKQAVTCDGSAWKQG